MSCDYDDIQIDFPVKLDRVVLKLDYHGNVYKLLKASWIVCTKKYL